MAWQMKDAIWFYEYHVTQTKAEIEYESMFNLSGGVAELTSIQVRQIMDSYVKAKFEQK